MSGLTPRLAPLPAIALLALGALAFRTVADQAPAFRESLQVESIAGDTRLRNLAQMYDRGAYYFQMGYGYLNADVLSFAGLEAPDEAASFETAADRFARAEALLAESLRHDPANAHAWLAYAQSLAARGATDAAEAALVTSWERGPHNARLALTRLHMIDLLRARRDAPQALAEIRAADLEMLRTHAPGMARAFLGS